MTIARQIQCSNEAWFLMTFYVQSDTGARTPASEVFARSQSRTIDCESLGLTDDTQIWPVVTAVAGKTNSGDHVAFSAAGGVAPYRVSGTTRDFSVSLGASAPAGWPSTIPIRRDEFQDWSTALQATVWIATPRNTGDVVVIANWAAQNRYRVRALGHSHNWSPLVVGMNDGSLTTTILVETTNLSGRSFDPGPPPRCTFGTGVSIEDATAFLEGQTEASPPGYTFLNFTAPGDLSMGGALAVGAHGTGIPVHGEPDLDGCLSNLVTSFTAVVSDPGGTYTTKTFDRTDPDASALLVHLGRAFITEVTMSVVPNYYLRVRNLYPSAEELFEAPSPSPSPNAVAQLVQRFGRIEVIWFPYTDKPWVKVWERVDAEISPQVGGPYNYPWANNISLTESRLIARTLAALPSTTPAFLHTNLLTASICAPEGAELNGTARDLLLYVRPSTLRVTAMGYCVQVPPEEVQGVLNTFYEKFTSLLSDYANQARYPLNSAVEVRFTTTDQSGDLGIEGAAPPAIAATNPLRGKDSADIVVWIDALTIAGTAYSNDFYSELEAWMLSVWGPSSSNVLRPEWSKGWAYTAEQGPWSNPEIIQSVIPRQYAEFHSAAATLALHDVKGIYTNDFLSRLFHAGSPTPEH